MKRISTIDRQATRARWRSCSPNAARPSRGVPLHISRCQGPPCLRCNNLTSWPTGSSHQINTTDDCSAVHGRLGICTTLSSDQIRSLHKQYRPSQYFQISPAPGRTQKAKGKRQCHGCVLLHSLNSPHAPSMHRQRIDSIDIRVSVIRWTVIDHHLPRGHQNGSLPQYSTVTHNTFMHNRAPRA